MDTQARAHTLCHSGNHHFSLSLSFSLFLIHTLLSHCFHYLHYSLHHSVTLSSYFFFFFFSSATPSISSSQGLHFHSAASPFLPFLVSFPPASCSPHPPSIGTIKRKQHREPLSSLCCFSGPLELEMSK